MAKASIFIKIGYWGNVELEVIWNRQEYWYYWNNNLIIFVSSHFLWVLFLRCLVKYQSANTMLVFPLILFTTLTIIYSSIYSINLSLLNIGPPYIVYCHNRQNNFMHFIWILVELLLSSCNNPSPIQGGNNFKLRGHKKCLKAIQLLWRSIAFKFTNSVVPL